MHSSVTKQHIINRAHIKNIGQEYKKNAAPPTPSPKIKALNLSVISSLLSYFINVYCGHINFHQLNKKQTRLVAK